MSRGFARRAFLFLSVLGLGVAARATEHWTVHASPSVPWQKARSVTVFKDQLIVSGDPAPGNSNALWVSTTGKTWTSYPLPAPGYVATFSGVNGRLFGFSVKPSTGANFLSICASADGKTWVPADNGQFGFGLDTWVDSISYGNRVFVGNLHGQVWASDGVGSPPVWTKLATPFEDVSQKVSVSFAVAGADLLVAAADDQGFFTFTTIYKTRDGVTWSNSPGAFSQDLFRPAAISFNNALYWGSTFLRYEPFPINLGETWDPLVAGVSPVPFVVNNQIHVVGPSAQILTQQDNGQWSPASDPLPTVCATDAPTYGHAATLNGETFVLPCDLISLRLGVSSVVAQPFVQGPLAAGQQTAVVAAWKTSVNFGDDLVQIRLFNLGSAQSGTDIAHLWLYRSSTGGTDVSRNPPVGEFASSDGGRTWTLPGSFHLTVSDGDTFFVAADIAATPTEDATVRFSLPRDGLSWTINASFQLDQDITPASALVIHAAGAVPVPLIDGVDVYPMPARSSVHFLYTLDATGEVTARIFDRTGTLIREINEPDKSAAPRATTLWDCSGNAPGVYFATIRIHSSASDRIFKKKLVIER